MRVVGIGQCSWDYLGTIDAYPHPDTKQEVREWQEQGGGPVATALVALARMGIPCDFCGIVGDDLEGDRIRRSLREEGIGTDGLLARKGAISQKAFIAVEIGCGSRTIFWARPSGGPLLPQELQPEFLDGCSFVHLDGLLTEVSLYAAGEARKRGIPVMLDAGKMRPGMLEIASVCDYVVAARQFALDLGWDGTPDGLFPLSDRLGPAVFTVTLGNRGSFTRCGDRIIHIPAFPVPEVDTTGAGDVFHGGFIFGLLKGLDLADTIRFASALAALKCTRIGGRAGIPPLEETASFLKRNGWSLPL